MNNKKGISAVVATVLIILITVAAVTIIWTAIVPMIRENLESGQVCLDSSSSLSIGSEYTCKDPADTYANIQIKRSSTGNFDLEGIKILLIGGGSTLNSTINNTASALPKENEDKVIRVSLTALGATSATEVSIAPVVKAGDRSKECDALQSVTFSDC